MVELPQQIIERLFVVREVISEHFTEMHWREVGLLTQCSRIIEHHPRLLRSLGWQDPDYNACVLAVLEKIVRERVSNLQVIEDYLVKKFADAQSETTACGLLNKYVCMPNVFRIPEEGYDPKLLALMMPFDAQFNPVCDAVKESARSVGLTCKRADDIWEDSTIIQDVFALIYRSAIVVCDFSGRNANVLYEAGVAHTLGRKVIPLAQHISDIPFDLRHHRHLMYLPNEQGLTELKSKLADKLRQEIGREGFAARGEARDGEAGDG